jgi:uncharacterized iron-regulated membrane protein
VLLRELHACVAVWFGLVLVFFLVSALPWTKFWGDELLAGIEAMTGQTSPAGFSPGGASVSRLTQAAEPIERAVAAARSAACMGRWMCGSHHGSTRQYA